MVTLRNPVQFESKLDAANAPRPLSVSDSVDLTVELPIADRTPADVDGPGQGIIVRANAVGAALTARPGFYENYEWIFTFWNPFDVSDKTLTLSQYCNMIMVMGCLESFPDEFYWLKAGAATLATFPAGSNYWLPIRAKTLYFNHSFSVDRVEMGIWGFY